MRSVQQSVALLSAVLATVAAQNLTVNPPKVYGESDFGSAATTGRYTADIVYGGATYVVQLDTGSSDFLLASDLCTDCAASQTKYPLTGIDTGCAANTKYGSATANYEVYLDTCTLAGATSTGQNVAVGALITEAGSLKSAYADGILGLAYASLSNIYTTCGKLPVTDLLVQDGVITNAFGLCFNNDNSGGAFVLGCAQVEGLVFTPVLKAQYYTVGVTGITYGDSQLSLDSSSQQAVIDSGTTVIVMPSNLFNQVLADVCAALGLTSADGCNSNTLTNDPIALTSDQVNSMPTLTITLQGGAQLAVPPTNYWLDAGNAGKGETYYYFGMQSGSQFVLGDVAMQGNYFFFDKGNDQVGIVYAPDCNPDKANFTGSCTGAVETGDTVAQHPLTLAVSFSVAFVTIALVVV